MMDYQNAGTHYWLVRALRRSAHGMNIYKVWDVRYVGARISEVSEGQLQHPALHF